MDQVSVPIRWVGVFGRQVVDMAKKKTLKDYGLAKNKKNYSWRPDQGGPRPEWVDEINKALARVEIFIPDDPKLSPEIRVDQDQEK